MESFKTTFALIAISVFIINLISDIYPSSKNRHTLMVVISVITIYICISPITSLINEVSDLKLDFTENSKEVSQDAYDTEFSEALTMQIEYEIGQYSTEVLSSKSIATSVFKNNKLDSLIIKVTANQNTNYEKEKSVIKYVEEHFGVTPRIEFV